MRKKLGLSEERIARGRELASSIVEPVMAFVRRHTTVTVERATLRVAGADGADPDGIPVPNKIVDSLLASGRGIGSGTLFCYASAVARTTLSPAELNERIAGGLDIASLPQADPERARALGLELVASGLARIAASRKRRESMLAEWTGRNHDPLFYLIVATGTSTRTWSRPRQPRAGEPTSSP